MNAGGADDDCAGCASADCDCDENEGCECDENEGCECGDCEVSVNVASASAVSDCARSLYPSHHHVEPMFGPWMHRIW